MATVHGDNYANTIYQDDYGYELDIYAYGGNDRIYLNISGPYGGFNFVDAGSGHDRVFNIYEGDNDIDLGTGSDYYVGDGFSTDPGLYDVVRGYDGNDVFEISTFHSDYYGEADNDTFYSAGFNNLLDGGSGIDAVSYELQDTDPDLAGRGVVLDLGREVVTTKGTNYAELLRSIENAVGSGASDDIFGSSGANSLWASAGNDYVNGGAGADYVYGEGGEDLVIGGLGNDVVSGGSGSDVFLFRAGDGADILTDFVPGSQADVVALQNTGFTSFADVQAHMSFYAAGNATYIQIGSDQVFFANILPHQFDVSDFVFV